jgi:hypothetical protein
MTFWPKTNLTNLTRVTDQAFGYYLTPAAGCPNLARHGPSLGETLLGESSLGETLLGESLLGETSLGEPTPYHVDLEQPFE